jgi:hypothetical protein
MPTATYVPIASNTVSGSTTQSIDFQNIPQIYTDLVVVLSGSMLTSWDVWLRVNNDSTSKCPQQWAFGDGGTQPYVYNVVDTVFYPVLNAHVTEPYLSIQNFPNYANAVTYKPYLNWSGNAQYQFGITQGAWNNTAAINRLTIFVDPAQTTTYFASGTAVGIYGIKGS